MKKGKKWYKSFGNWMFILACVILIPMLVMNLSIMFQAKKESDKVPNIFGYKPFMVLSGSMETEIRKGDLIITKMVEPETLKLNDIIAFRDGKGTVTTHRIIDIVLEDDNTYFITKGDNNNIQDKNLVEFDDIEGIYVGRIPGIGSMMKSLTEPTTIVILILGVTAIFVIGFSISSKKQRDIERQEFLEYKRLKEKEQEKLDQEQQEFLEYKKLKEQQNNRDSKNKDKSRNQ